MSQGKVCSVAECVRPVKSRGMCGLHYERQRIGPSALRGCSTKGCCNLFPVWGRRRFCEVHQTEERRRYQRDYMERNRRDAGKARVGTLLSLQCGHCGSQFKWFYGRKGKIRVFCDECISERNRMDTTKSRSYVLRRFGLTAEGLDRRVKGQNGCAICHCQHPGLRDGRPLGWQLDHDHSCCANGCSRCFRGALCWHCNVGIGHLRDDPDRLRAAALYIEETQLAEGAPRDFAKAS
jgi:hypothetical protein